MTHVDWAVLYLGMRACYIRLRSGRGSDGNVYIALRGLRDFWKPGGPLRHLWRRLVGERASDKCPASDREAYANARLERSCSEWGLCVAGAEQNRLLRRPVPPSLAQTHGREELQINVRPRIGKPSSSLGMARALAYVMLSLRR